MLEVEGTKGYECVLLATPVESSRRSAINDNEGSQSPTCSTVSAYAFGFALPLSSFNVGTVYAFFPWWMHISLRILLANGRFVWRSTSTRSLTKSPVEVATLVQHSGLYSRYALGSTLLYRCLTLISKIVGLFLVSWVIQKKWSSKKGLLPSPWSLNTICLLWPAVYWCARHLCLIWCHPNRKATTTGHPRQPGSSCIGYNDRY